MSKMSVGKIERKLQKLNMKRGGYLETANRFKNLNIVPVIWLRLADEIHEQMIILERKLEEWKKKQ